ncbi:stage III sporulation protein AF [Halalkalibacterium ligniniphilum]|uniref:stage III sporulation protein AF n=1 Tax=Halalkalibacterium ligniniphilum TaxID=1134413 RepID=UPI000346252D|nr:stage III sporulation protein AF [Halalkalibacterium ligniniphilum]
MAFLTDWLTNIILLILLATILELMLPSTGLQRYVKMVIGLLLLVVMLQPILSIFTEDVDAWLLTAMNQHDSEQVVSDNRIEMQKNEIETGQRAYISEQVAVQLKRQVEEEFRDQFAFELADVQIIMDNWMEGTFQLEHIDTVQVYVQTADDGSHPRDPEDEAVHVPSVAVVHINTSERTEQEDLSAVMDESVLKEFLAEAWQVPKEKISLVWEGGSRENESR